MLIGSAVMFNGIKVGEVTDLRINPDNPQSGDRDHLRHALRRRCAPIRRQAWTSRGLTGIAVVSLTGGKPERTAAEIVTTASRHC